MKPWTRSAAELGRANRAQGEHGQEIAANALRMLGLVEVEVIETGWRVFRAREGDRSKIVRAVPCRKVSGDLRAVVPGSGRSVLCEVKVRDKRLAWGDLSEHQHAALQRHQDAGALALVAWVSPDGVFVMRRSNMLSLGWSKGRPLTVEDADGISIKPGASRAMERQQ